MMENDKVAEQLTETYIRQLGLEEPSPDFTANIMKVVEADRVTKPAWKPQWWWILTPLAVVAVWIAFRYLIPGSTLQYFFSGVSDLINPIVHATEQMFSGLRNVHLSPASILTYAALLLLLGIEEFLTRHSKITES